MWIRLASRYVLAKLPLPLVRYRLHAASLSNKADAMELAELRVLREAFTKMPALKGRWLLRRKTFSLAALASAQQFRCNGMPGTAIKRVLWSMLLWPLPFGKRDASASLIRIRVLVNLLLRIVHLRRQKSLPGSAGDGGAPDVAQLTLDVGQ
jgi:hypothetical protein